ncbi:hypothetical protein C627_04385 [Corynebacterium glutamicum ZL-6]|nr:hypothetical protein C628_04395 [[Brevibacterium] flavum ZL-1]ANR64863.1 hypothetical protein C627_04385 [Corynebacterium glutamicum ZL-6]PST76293.1 hypothetical protein I919_04457 [Corynebacterium glutamicum ZL-2]BCB34581.1 hypothetical protein KaCgl_25550 [Corynebacterium glutamicum]
MPLKGAIILSFYQNCRKFILVWQMALLAVVCPLETRSSSQFLIGVIHPSGTAFKSGLSEINMPSIQSNGIVEFRHDLLTYCSHDGKTVWSRGSLTQEN